MMLIFILYSTYEICLWSYVMAWSKSYLSVYLLNITVFAKLDKLKLNEYSFVLVYILTSTLNVTRCAMGMLVWLNNILLLIYKHKQIIITATTNYFVYLILYYCIGCKVCFMINLTELLTGSNSRDDIKLSGQQMLPIVVPS